MKFTIESQVLKLMLADLSRAIPAKSALPILSGFLFEIKGDKLRITASDAEIAFRGVLKLDKADSDGEVVIPASILLELMKTLPSGPVAFATVDDTAITLTWENGNSQLPTFDAKDFPVIAVPEKDNSFSVVFNSDILATAITKTIGSVANDQRRPMLGGIFFDLKPGLSTLVATDSQRLVLYDIKTDELKDESSFSLPAKVAAILKAVLPKDTFVTVVHDGKNARFAFGAMELTTRLLVGKFPNYVQVIPKDNPSRMVSNREALIQTVNRMGVVSNRKTSLLRFALSYNKVDILAEDLGMATKGEESLACDYDGNDITIGLKAPVIADMLSLIETDKVSIDFKDERRALLITPEGEKAEENTVRIILMPWKIGK